MANQASLMNEMQSRIDSLEKNLSETIRQDEKERKMVESKLKTLSDLLQKSLPIAAGLQPVIDDGSTSGIGGVSFSLTGDETLFESDDTTIGGSRGFESDLDKWQSFTINATINAKKDLLKKAQDSALTNVKGLAKIDSLQKALSSANSSIEQLEHELTIKAQECEDANDKEIALRKEKDEMQIQLEETKKRSDLIQVRKEELENELAEQMKNFQETIQSKESKMKEMQVDSALIINLQDALTSANSSIEQLEHALTIKAQECEDADDKEIALREENKRLAAFVVALKARIDKDQQQQKQSVAIAAPIPTSNSLTSINPSVSLSSNSNNNNTSSTSRKRPNPDTEVAEMDRKQAKLQHLQKCRTYFSSLSPTPERAYIDTPGPASLTAMATIQGQTQLVQQGKKSSIQDIPSSNKDDNDDDDRMNRLPSSSFNFKSSQTLPKSLNKFNGSSNPNDVVRAMRRQVLLKEIGIVGVSNSSSSTQIKDRTNKPRQIMEYSQTDLQREGYGKLDLKSNQTTTNDNNFMAKFCGYRSISATTATTTTNTNTTTTTTNTNTSTTSTTTTTNTANTANTTNTNNPSRIACKFT